MFDQPFVPPEPNQVVTESAPAVDNQFAYIRNSNTLPDDGSRQEMLEGLGRKNRAPADAAEPALTLLKDELREQLKPIRDHFDSFPDNTKDTLGTRLQEIDALATRQATGARLSASGDSSDSTAPMDEDDRRKNTLIGSKQIRLIQQMTDEGYKFGPLSDTSRLNDEQRYRSFFVTTNEKKEIVPRLAEAQRKRAEEGDRQMNPSLRERLGEDYDAYLEHHDRLAAARQLAHELINNPPDYDHETIHTVQVNGVTRAIPGRIYNIPGVSERASEILREEAQEKYLKPLRDTYAQSRPFEERFEKWTQTYNQFLSEREDLSVRITAREMSQLESKFYKSFERLFLEKFDSADIQEKFRLIEADRSNARDGYYAIDAKTLGRLEDNLRQSQTREYDSD